MFLKFSIHVRELAELSTLKSKAGIDDCEGRRSGVLVAGTAAAPGGAPGTVTNASNERTAWRV
jgi:hypothetical protein